MKKNSTNRVPQLNPKKYNYFCLLVFITYTLCFSKLSFLYSQSWENISPTFDPPGNYTLLGTFENAMEGWIIAWGLKSLYHTQDGGSTWTVQMEGDTTYFYDLLFVDNINGWAKLYNGTPFGDPNVPFLLRTNDGGELWQGVSTPPDPSFYAMTFIDSLMGYYGGDSTIYRTSNGGESWQPQTIESEVSFELWDIYFVDEQYGWAVGYSDDYLDAGIILKTIDGGWTWQINEHPSSIIGNAVYFTDTVHGVIAGFNLFAGGLIRITEDGGETWVTHEGFGSWLNDVVFTDDSTGWVVGEYGYICYTEDGGNTWEQVESGTNADLERIVFVDNGETGYIFGKNSTLLKYEVSTSIISNDSNIPSVFKLYQNYPNPFNPKTVITYELKNSVFVSLKVYDLMGNEVITFVNELQRIGDHQIVWNGRNQYGKKVKSGIYICQLKANSFSQNIKLLLIR